MGGSHCCNVQLLKAFVKALLRTAILRLPSAVLAFRDQVLQIQWYKLLKRAFQAHIDETIMGARAQQSAETCFIFLVKHRAYVEL